MRPLTVTCCALLAALSLGLCLCPVPRAAAANFTVNSLADTPDAQTGDGACADSNGACTLRAAIQEAGGNAVPDAIGFAVNGTVNLTGALPDITSDLTINGPGAASLTVRRAGGGEYRILTVASGVTAAVNGLTITNGLAPALLGPVAGGGGVYNAGALSMSGCAVSLNSTATPAPDAGAAAGSGGGIFNSGTLTLTGCTVNNNSTGNGGGGSSNTAGDGGGILNNGELTMTDCEVIWNRTGRGATTSAGGGYGGSGGGIANISTLRMYACGVSNNVTGDGADAQQGVVNPAGKGGSGGGVFNAGAGTTTAVNTVVSGNFTGRGGKSSGVNCGQGDGGDGAGIANPGGTLKLSQSTVVNNQAGLLGEPCGRDGQGGGVYGGAKLRSSIIAFNSSRHSSGAREVFGGAYDSRGYNFVGVAGGACCFVATDHFGTTIDQSIVGLDGNLLPNGKGWSLDGALALDVDDQPVLTDRRGRPRPSDFADFPIGPQPGGDQSDMGAFERQADEPLPPPSPTPTPTTVQFITDAYPVLEDCRQVDVAVTRAGPKDGTTVVGYSIGAGGVSADDRRDFTPASGTLTFAPGEETKLIPVLISEDAYAEGEEWFHVSIGNVQGGQLGLPSLARVYIVDDDETDGTFNPIDDNAVFVAQHYHDFFSREADPGGLAFWKGELDACDGDPGCLDLKRADVSAAFFLSIEFQRTGYFVIRVDLVAFDHDVTWSRNDSYRRETQKIGQGVFVGQPDWEQTVEARRQLYVEEYVARPGFQSVHGRQNAEQYVDSLFSNPGVTPTQSERDAALSAFGAGGLAGQAAALRSVVESGSVYNKLYNTAFVLMQYFAYLRRNPDDHPENSLDGYHYWLSKLDSFTLPGEDARDESVALSRVRRAEMVRAFLLSDEYRGRFQGDPNRGY